MFSVVLDGFEPSIPCLSGRCLATRPQDCFLLRFVSFCFLSLFVEVSKAPSRFELAQHVLQTCPAPHGLVLSKSKWECTESNRSPTTAQKGNWFTISRAETLPNFQALSLIQRKTRDSNPERFLTATVFKTASSSSRMPSVSQLHSNRKRRGQESNLWGLGSEPSLTASSLPGVCAPDRQAMNA